MERPLFLPLFSIVSGLSLAGLFFRFFPAPYVFPLLAVAFCAIFLKNRYPFLISVSLLLFVWGNLSLQPFLQPHHGPDHIVNFASEEPVTVEGIIDGRPEATEQGSRLYLRVERVYRKGSSAPASGRLLLYIGEGRVELLTGDRVRFVSRIHKPRNYGLPGEFDYGRYLALRNVFATGFVKGADDVILIREGVGNRAQRRIDAVAVQMGKFIGMHVPPAEGSILRALLLGDMGYVSKATKDAYTRTGVNHILSISGFHVGIVAIFMFHLLFCVAKTSEFLLLHLNLRRFALVLTLPAVIFYLFLSGAAPATTRSVVMIAAYIAALLLEREVDPINSLMLAAMFILALSPPALFEISFQLSFLALWGILVLTPLFMTPFRAVESPILRKVILFFMASAAATAATIFPVAYYFHRASITGLISNFFVVPLMGYGAVVLGFTALLFVFPAPVIAVPLFAAAAFLVKLSNGIIMYLARIPILTFLNPTRLDLFLFYIFFVSLTFIRAKGARVLCCGSIAAALAVSGAIPHDRDAGSLKITFFSVGQGEATLITFPDGTRMLIDGGGSARVGGADVGERLLAPALWKMGVRSLDYMVLTHPHPDHLQGLTFIAANFRVGEFWEGGSFVESADYRELKRILAEKQVPVRRVDASAGPIKVGGAVIEPLAPFVHHSHKLFDEYADVNEESLVFRLVLGSFAVLFTGDAGRDTEELLLARPELLKCNILKVPHHGSRHSNSIPFLRATAPEIAVISAGYGNSFHLPAQETLDSLHRLGITVYRTDCDGTVEAVHDGRGGNASIRTFRMETD
ncbi:MAG: competence protein [Geobacteraceae bacterium]|nr:MAG: competence protein [Geobacteraceae bacterium]